MRLSIVLLLLCDLAQAQMPIAEAREFRSGRTVTVNGHVTATFGNLSFIQDMTAAIAVYGADVAVNDSISATGKLSKFNGLLEIVSDSVRNLGPRPALKPKIVNRIFDHEGELVRIENVRAEPKGLFFYPQRAGIFIKNTDSIQYWIDENTDIPGYSIPETTSVTGVVSRYGNQFQLLPRAHTDLDNTHNTQPTTHNNFTIVNWNVEFLGAPKYGPSNDSLQVANVALVLNAIQPDIVALQEVSNDDAFRTLMNTLPGYNGRCSSRYSYSFDQSGDFPPQKLCFVYKMSAVNVIREKVLFRKLFDDKPSDMFSSGRLPYLLEVEAGNRRFSLINIHAKSGDDESSYSRRVVDANALKDTLDTYSDFILLGDFNDDVDKSIVTDHESPYSGFEICVSKPLSETGWHSTISYDDMIDHQVVSPSMKDYHLSTSIVNVFRLIPLYGRTTSDHLPILSEFDFTIAGLEDESASLYPNPTNGNLYFPENSDVAIINSMGQVIIQKQNAHPPISLGECAPGLYFVVLGDQIFKIIRN